MDFPLVFLEEDYINSPASTKDNWTLESCPDTILDEKGMTTPMDPITHASIPTENLVRIRYGSKPFLKCYNIDTLKEYIFRKHVGGNPIKDPLIPSYIWPEDVVAKIMNLQRGSFSEEDRKKILEEHGDEKKEEKLHFFEVAGAFLVDNPIPDQADTKAVKVFLTSLSNYLGEWSTYEHLGAVILLLIGKIYEKWTIEDRNIDRQVWHSLIPFIDPRIFQDFDLYGEIPGSLQPVLIAGLQWIEHTAVTFNFVTWMDNLFLAAIETEDPINIFKWLKSSDWYQDSANFIKQDILRFPPETRQSWRKQIS